jgi:inner membrane transporter RhtA
VYVPVGIITLLRHPPTASALGYAASAGGLSSAVPFLADLLALRRVPARFFGVFMSVNPVLAALVGLLILDQSLGWAEWLAITTIVIANTVSVLTADRRRPSPTVTLGPLDRVHRATADRTVAMVGGPPRVSLVLLLVIPPAVTPQVRNALTRRGR